MAQLDAKFAFFINVTEYPTVFGDWEKTVDFSPKIAIRGRNKPIWAFPTFFRSRFQTLTCELVLGS
jgi:hypothetical protein